MAEVKTSLQNGVSYGYKHTVTATDVSDGYVTVDFQANVDLVPNVQVQNLNGITVPLTNAKVTTPANGKIKLENGVASVAESQKVTMVADVSNSLGGKYFLVSGNTTNYYVWFDTVGKQEIFTVETVADSSRSLGGKYFTFSKAGTNYYVWISIPGVTEQFTVETVADVAGSLNSTYFTFSKSGTNYYVWYNVNSAGVDPAVADSTGVPVALATGATAAQVATATQSAIDALAGVTATVDDDLVTVTLDAVGNVTDAADGAAATGFTIVVTRQGIAASVDPAPADKTGVPVVIAANDTANTIATAVKVAIDALAGVGAGVVDDLVTVTTDARGSVANAADVDSTFTITVTQAGVDASTDPAVATRTGIKIETSTNATATAIATIAQPVIDAISDLVCTRNGAILTITSAAGANVPDVSAGNSGVTVEKVTEGVGSGTPFALDVGQKISFLSVRNAAEIYTYSA